MNVSPASGGNIQADLGLKNRDTAAERIASMRATTQRVSDNNAYESNLSTDSKADLGLQDRHTNAERLQSSQSLNNRVVENHGFDAKRAVKEALVNNTKIINIPVQRRGSLLDVSV